MIAQTIKNWFRKMFAWWPWKQSTPLEYQHVADAVAGKPAPGTSLWISQEGTVPPTNPPLRRLTLESRTERLPQARMDTPEASSPQQATLPALLPADRSTVEHASTSATPTPQQRLEFLRYLVQRGLVNEGFADDQAGSSPD